jgi:hypothetical protein
MDTRKKLNEAKYFLDLLPNFQEDENRFYYNLSAFLNAWRSVLDIMFYDFAEHYLLGFTREDDMNDKEFSAVATTLGRAEAVEFVKWWRKKQGVLKADSLWEKRIISFHRGNVEIYQNIYALGTGGTSGTISWTNVTIGVAGATVGATEPTVGTRATLGREATIGVHTHQQITAVNFWSFKDFPDENLIDKCKEGYSKLESIVKEAEATFHIQL